MRIVVLVLTVFAVLACVAAVGYGISWARAEHDSDLELAQTRDDVLRDAGQAAVNLNTLDFARLDQALDLWERSSTGQVLENYLANRDQYANYIEQSRRRTTATVVDGAVAELDTDDGRARVLIVLEIETSPEGQQASVSRQRFDMELGRTSQGWKISSMGPVSAPVPGEPPR